MLCCRPIKCLVAVSVGLNIHIYRVCQNDWSGLEVDYIYMSGNGKEIPLQALTGPEGSRSLRLPDFKTIEIRKWQDCQPYAPAAFTPRIIPGTHFC
jgi:hypothetical protein